MLVRWWDFFCFSIRLHLKKLRLLSVFWSVELFLLDAFSNRSVVSLAIRKMEAISKMELFFIYTMQQKNIKYKGYIIFVLNCSQNNSNLFLVQTKHILRTTIPNSSLSHSPKYHKEWKDFRLSLLFLYYFFHLSRFILSNYFFIISGKIVSTHFIFKKCIKNCHSELQFEKRNTYLYEF